MSLNKRLINTGGGGEPGSLNTFTYQGINTQVYGQRDIWFKSDGTKFYECFYINTRAYIRQYSLSTAWDLSTETVDYTRDLTTEFTNLQSLTWGFCMSYDGTVAWHQRQNSSIRAQVWTLSTPHDFSTATYVGTPGGGYNLDYLVAGWYENKNGGMAVSPDGSFLAFVNNNTRALSCSADTYHTKLTAADMPTPNDLFSSPLGINKPRVCGVGGGNLGKGICYNGDGTKIYQGNGSTVYEFDLPTPYETNNGVLVNSMSLPSGAGNGLYMSPDNTKLFVSSGSGILVYTA
jgi:hypothetical protein